MTGHVPARRTWLCVSCGRDWPCTAARVELLDEYQDVPVALAMYLGSAFVECAIEMADIPVGELSRRFFAWFRLRR